MDNKRGLYKLNFIVLSAIIIIVIAIILSYFTFFYSKDITNQEDFNKALFNCNKIQYINDESSATWQYIIRGEKEKNCIIDVKLITVKKGTADLKDLEGKEMICYVPLKLVINPISNLKNCHGLLKENIQELYLTNMHKYVISNLDVIGQAFNSTG